MPKITGIVVLSVALLAGILIWIRFAWSDVSALARVPVGILVAGGLLASMCGILGLLVRTRVEQLRSPRLVSPTSRFVAILAAASGSGGGAKVWIGYQPETGLEGRGFAESIAWALRDAKWECWPSPPGEANEGRFSGIRLVAHAGPRDPTKQPEHARRLAALKQAIAQLGQPCQIYPNPTDDETVGDIVVGLKATGGVSGCVEKPDESDRFLGR